MHDENSATMATSVGTITLDSQAKVLSFDTACELIFECHAAQIVAQPIKCLLHTSALIEFEQGMKSLLDMPDAHITGAGFELLGQRWSGDTFSMHLSVGVMAVAGVHAFVCLVADVSERKVIEQHRDHFKAQAGMAATEVNAIVQTAVSGIVTMDQMGIIRLFNPAAEALFGWCADDIIGKNVTVLMSGMHAKHHDAYLQRYLDTRQAHIVGIGREIVAKRKDGSTFPAQLEVGDAQFSHDKHLFVAFISDISAQKQAEKELIDAKNAAEAALRTKANFLATMSHEIRTPMNAVIGFSEIVLQDAALAPSTQRHIQTIHNAARHLLGIIKDILDFSKIEAGKVVLEAVCFHLPNAVQEALQTVAFRAKEKGLLLSFNVANELPLHFVGDPTRLCQVILNLVDNAIKFTDKGHITVSINAAKEADMIHFSVSDTGVGMTAKQSERIFESFSQADNTTARRFGGTGLGTTISKQIVEMMNGQMWLDTHPGQGSTFHFTVNMPVATDIENCLYEQTEETLEAFISPRRFNVLLAEDIEVNATLVMLRLEQQGHSVHWVKDGQAAVEQYRTGEYDLILMDIQMPVLGGMDATALIRADEQTSGRHVPIIALTASVMKEDQCQFLKADMDAVVGKPIDFEALFVVMERVVSVGVGQTNHSIRINDPCLGDSIDFSSLTDLADVDKALSAWRDPELYAKALFKFAEEQASDAIKMLALFDHSPVDKKSVCYIAHALKGLAGNLALQEVHSLSTELDVLLDNADNKGVLALLSRLDLALGKVCSAITLLRLPGQVSPELRQKCDAEEVSALLKTLLATLDELNPEVAAPVLKTLVNYLSVTEISAIQQRLDAFDFDGAKAVIESLLLDLGLGD